MGLWDADISAGKTLVEYVWVAADSQLRSKTRVLDARPTCIEDVPVLTASVADGDLPTECEVLLQPRKLFRDPFREGSHLLVLCDTFQISAPPPPPCTSSGPVLPAFSFAPHNSNHRAACAEVLACSEEEQPVFAFEQEYCVKPAEVLHLPGLCSSGGPLAHPYIPLPGQHTCQVTDAPLAGAKPAPPLGAEARRLAHLHLLTCLRAGINISEISQKARATDSSSYEGGTPSATAPPVWSYQLGPSVGIDAADHLWMSRFVMQRVSEQEGIEVSFDSAQPKSTTHSGNSGGLRCHTEVSTSASRAHGSGLSEIERHMVLMHAAQLQQGLPGYGKLSKQAAQLAATGGLRVGAGKSSANPSLDIMIPTVTLMQQGGYWVDCRPAADADPYSVITALVTALQLPKSSRAALPGAALHQFHATECLNTCFDNKLAPTYKRGKSLHDPAPCYSSYASDISSLMSDEADSDDTASMNSLTSEDVLIAEINKIDRAPKRARNSQTQGGSYTKHASCGLYDSYQCPFVEEGFDEYCSSKWSSVHA